MGQIDNNFIILIVTVIVNSVLAAFVYKNNTNSATNKIFGLLSIVTSFWLVFIYLSVTPQFYPSALIWIRLSILFAAAQISLFYLLAKTIPSERIKITNRRLWILITATIAIMINALSPFAFTGTEVVNGVVVAIPGPTIVLFGLFAIYTTLAAIRALIVRIKNSSGKLKGQIRYVLAGELLMQGLIITTVLIPVIIFKKSDYVQYTPFYTLIFLGSITYAIVRKSLFDIKAAVARSVAYLLSIGIIGIVYGGIIYIILNLLGSNLVSPDVERALYIILALVTATFYPITKRYFDKITKKLFYQDAYETQELVNSVSLILASEIRIKELTDKVAQQMIATMHLSSATTIVYDGATILCAEDGILSKLGANPEQSLAILGNKLVNIDDLKSKAKLEVLEQLGVSAAVALKTSKLFLGYLLVGDKKSGEIFTKQDINTIKTIASELSLALENAIAFAEIQQFNITLQHKIDQATKNLRSANDQLKELDLAKDEFISMASHQLRTPLTTVKGYVSMLNDGDFGKLSADQKSSIELALDGSNRMASLINDLLNVSRIEAGKFYIDTAKVDLNKIIPEELSLLKSLASSKKVHLKYIHPHSPVPILNLDENKTRQAIMNLIDNAIGYSAPNIGKVEVSLAVDNGRVILAVKDNGIGVPINQQSKLFTKMFRASNAKDVRPDGTGLGLYLVKRVIEDQGGSIIFESKPGKGSTFGFSIPVHNHIKPNKNINIKPD